MAAKKKELILCHPKCLESDPRRLILCNCRCMGERHGEQWVQNADAKLLAAMDDYFAKLKQHIQEWRQPIKLRVVGGRRG